MIDQDWRIRYGQLFERAENLLTTSLELRVQQLERESSAVLAPAIRDTQSLAEIDPLDFPDAVAAIRNRIDGTLKVRQSIDTEITALEQRIPQRTGK